MSYTPKYMSSCHFGRFRSRKYCRVNIVFRTLGEAMQSCYNAIANHSRVAIVLKEGMHPVNRGKFFLELIMK